MWSPRFAIAALFGAWLVLASSTASAWVRPQAGTPAATGTTPAAAGTPAHGEAGVVPAPAPWMPDPAAPAAGAGTSEAAAPSGPALPAAPAPAVGSTEPVGLLAAKAPAPAPKVPLYKQWWFWTVAGGLFAGTVLVTYVVTRPPPAPYYGNVLPGIFEFP